MKIYKKQGRKYVEIGTYESEYIYYPHGAHLVWSRPGVTTTRYKIEPADAAVMAALERLRDVLTKELTDAMKMQPESREYTKLEKKAIKAIRDVLGDGLNSIRFEGLSVFDIVNKAIQRLKQEL